VVHGCQQVKGAAFGDPQEDLMARESEFRGRTIRTTSYENRQGKWIPRAEIVTIDSRGTHKRSVRSTRERATRGEADAEALLLAQRWIDAHPADK
jgi:hypothetical protein